MDFIEELKSKSYPGRWRYQQSVYVKQIKRTLLMFFMHFPSGYLNLMFQCLFALAALPILLGNTLEYWVQTVLIVKPSLEDIFKIKDKTKKRLVVKAQRKAIEDHQSVLKGLIGFIIGITTALILSKLSP